MINNGIGLPVYGNEQRIVDYTLLAADQKAVLPSQVQAKQATFDDSPAFQFTICTSTTSDALLTILSFFQLLRQSGNPWISLSMSTTIPSKEENVFLLTVRGHP